MSFGPAIELISYGATRGIESSFRQSNKNRGMTILQQKRPGGEAGPLRMFLRATR
jgi:hypothetical protein